MQEAQVSFEAWSFHLLGTGLHFNVKEVEGVKTTFQLIPVVPCAVVAKISIVINWLVLIQEKHTFIT